MNTYSQGTRSTTAMRRRRRAVGGNVGRRVSPLAPLVDDDRHTRTGDQHHDARGVRAPLRFHARAEHPGHEQADGGEQHDQRAKRLGPPRGHAVARQVTRHETQQPRHGAWRRQTTGSRPWSCHRRSRTSRRTALRSSLDSPPARTRRVPGRPAPVRRLTALMHRPGFDQRTGDEGRSQEHGGHDRRPRSTAICACSECVRPDGVDRHRRRP